LREEGARGFGLLIVNADDWGKDRVTTDRIFDCVRKNVVTSVSGMVFMEDSSRSAEIARNHGLEPGLHLNFTSRFTAPYATGRLLEHLDRTSRFLAVHPIARAIFHPRLVSAFEYLVQAQVDEFQRIYAKAPARFDGHHHMHLCANVLMQRLLPEGTVVRRHFFFTAAERGVVNRLYRQLVDKQLAMRHFLVDYLFNLMPLTPPGRLRRIFSLARESVVELETHPASPEEHRFLLGESFHAFIENVSLGSFSSVVRPEEREPARLSVGSNAR
jgi:predicted glycoside hydrolase/deacetylase ChbG (UPF0249 family)